MTIIATNNGPSQTATLGITPNADFSLTLSPSSVSVAAGSTATSQATISDQSGFPGSVTLSATGQPSNVNVTFSQNPVNGEGNSTITFAATSAAVPGTYTVAIQGSASIGTHTKHINLTVTAPPDFALVLSPMSLSVAQGSTGTSQASVTYTGGFTGSVALSATGLPSGVSATFNPTSISGSSTSTITFLASSSAATGTTSVSIVGTASTGSHTKHINLTVNTTTSANPVGIVAYSTGNGKVSIYWTRSSGATGYNVYRSVTAGGENYSNPINGTTLTNNPSYSGSSMDIYTDTGLTNGTFYYYTVKAVYGSTSSVASTEDGDAPSQYSVPWDSRNPGTIINAFEAAFAVDVSNAGETFGHMRVAGPDGSIYDSDSSTAQTPDGILQSGTNQVTLTDGEVVSEPDESGQYDAYTPGSSAVPNAVPASLAASKGPYRLVSTQSAYRGVEGYLILPDVHTNSKNDTPCNYLGLGGQKGQNGVDAGLQWSQLHSQWEIFMNINSHYVQSGGPTPPDYHVHNREFSLTQFPPQDDVDMFFIAYSQNNDNTVNKLQLLLTDDNDGDVSFQGGLGCPSAYAGKVTPNQIVKRVHAIAQQNLGVLATGTTMIGASWGQGLVIPGNGYQAVAWNSSSGVITKDGIYSGGSEVDVYETSPYVAEDNISILIQSP